MSLPSPGHNLRLAPRMVWRKPPANSPEVARFNREALYRSSAMFLPLTKTVTSTLSYLEIVVHKGIDGGKGRMFPNGPIRGLVYKVVELGEMSAHMVDVHPCGESL